MTNCEGDGGDTKQMRDACVGVLSHIIMDVNDTLTNIVSGRPQYHISLRIFFLEKIQFHYRLTIEGHSRSSTSLAKYDNIM